MAYVLPQVQVFQEFRQLPNAVVANLNAFIFGPNYQLFRYAEANEKALVALGEYDPTADTTYEYPLQPAGSTVDLTYVKVFMENLWAEYAAIPASGTTALVAMSPVERNKLRAAPRIYCQTAYTGHNTLGVLFNDGEAGGFYTGGVALPENYYFYPQNTGDLQSEDVTLGYATTEGYSGAVVVEATNSPLTAGVYTPLADGIMAKLTDTGSTRAAATLTYDASTALVATDSVTIGAETLVAGTDFTTLTGVAMIKEIKAAYEAAVGGASEAVEYLELVETSATAGYLRVLKDGGAVTLTVTVAGLATGDEPVASASASFPGMVGVGSFKFIGSGGAELAFTLTPEAIALLADVDVDGGASDQFHVIITDTGTLGATYTASSRTLQINYNNGVDTLAEVRAEVLGESTAGEWFEATVLDPDQGEETADSVEDGTGPLGDDYAQFMIRDCYRITVEPNPYVFATGNGVSNSAHFKTRGVQVGDRVRYSVLGTDATVYEGTTYVTGIEADETSSVLHPTAVSDNNAAGQSGTVMSPNQVATTNDIMVPGDENRRDMDGVLTALYALSNTYQKYPGQYSAGLLSDTYTVTITTAGVAGTARATVSSDGGYYRENAVIAVDSLADGALFLGNNLWVRFDQGTGDADAEFQLGDTYTFSTDVTAPFNATPAQDAVATGNYRGPRDTTYVVEVVRGGVFTRDAAVLDGLQTANKATVSLTGAPTGNLVIGGITIAQSGANAGAGAIALAAAVNAAAVRAVATTGAVAGDSTASVVIQAQSDVIAGATADTAVNWSLSKAYISVTTDLDWSAGDVDDEYILRCTTAGTLNTAVFSVSSLLGDIESGIQFSDGVLRSVGAQGLDLQLDLTGTPQFTVGDYWVIQVFGARPQVRITDTAGVDQASYAVVVPQTAIDLGVYGGQITFDTNRNLHGGLAANSNGGLNKGDVFYVEAEASADGALKTLVLADDLPEAVITGREVGDMTDTDATNDWTPNYNPTEFAVWLYLVQDATEIDAKKVQAPPAFNWEADADGVTLNADIQVVDDAWVNGDGSQDYLPVYKGDLYLEYRALLADYADGIYSISDIGDVVDTLGVVHPDNPLAQGVFNALSNSGDQPVYFMGVPSDDLDGYSEVFDRAGLVDTVYGFVPLTTDLQILTALEAHINELSGAENKRWRIGFVSTDLPTETGLYTAETSTDGATDWEATVGDNPAVSGTQYTLVTITNGDPTLLADVDAGDLVRVQFAADAWGDESYEEYTITRVLTNKTLLIEGGTDVAINVASKIEIWHTNSAPEVAAAVKARSEGFGNRRIYHVFPSVLFLDGVLQGGEFAAAAIAGLVSSVPPQQGLTSIEVNGFDDIPAVYRTYNRTQLNTMAEGGTLILMQDQAGGRIYIRHQVSTAAVDGNLLTTELSVTKNLDAVSYYFAAVLEPFYGRYNITPELLDVIETQLQNGLNFLGSDQVSAGLLGPMLILENDNTQIRSIEQHPTLRDHIVVIIDLEMPLPANVIQLRLVVGDTETSATIG